MNTEPRNPPVAQSPEPWKQEAANPRSQRAADPSKKDSFEKALKRKGSGLDGEEVEGDPVACGAFAPLPELLRPTLGLADDVTAGAIHGVTVDSYLRDGQMPTASSGHVFLAAAEAPGVAVGLVEAPRQAQLFQHMALPHGARDATAQFDVLNEGSLVSRIELAAGAFGARAMTVVAPSEHATLLDRYLPQLQRRVAEKWSPHVRIEASDERGDNTGGGGHGGTPR